MIKAQRGTKDILNDEIPTWQWIVENAKNVFQNAGFSEIKTRFIKSFAPQMVGIGPFIPHHDTPFADKPAGTAELTLFLLAIVRLMNPKVLLPATTALGTIEGDGRERGILAGCNVVMPNLSPQSVRKKYMLYDNKLSSGEEAAEARRRSRA